MKKIGIMGGTFNPIHYAHLLLAENAYEQFHLDEIIFLPSRQPAYKNGDEIVSGEHRLNMIKLAIENNTHFTYSKLELEREGNTYTADTLVYLTNKYPDTEFFFIIGGDSLFQIEGWCRPQVVLQLSHILAAGRGEKSEEEMLLQIEELKKKYQAEIDYLRIPMFEVSSNLIRERLMNGKSVRYLLPDNVLSYIKEHHLYEFR